MKSFFHVNKTHIQLLVLFLIFLLHSSHNEHASTVLFPGINPNRILFKLTSKDEKWYKISIKHLLSTIALYSSFFYFIYHIYPPFRRKRIVSLCLGRYVCTCLGVAISEVFGPSVFHIKVGRPIKCLAQEHNKQTCRLVLHNLPLNAKRHAGKLWISFFKVFWYDPTRGINPRSADCEANALIITPSRRCLKRITKTLNIFD